MLARKFRFLGALTDRGEVLRTQTNKKGLDYFRRRRFYGCVLHPSEGIDCAGSHSMAERRRAAWEAGASVTVDRFGALYDTLTLQRNPTGG